MPMSIMSHTTRGSPSSFVCRARETSGTENLHSCTKAHGADCKCWERTLRWLVLSALDELFACYVRAGSSGERRVRIADSPTLGQSATRTSQNCRGRALAASDRSSEWHSSKNKVRDVGFVFARRSVGVLWPQSHFIRDTGGNWGQARPEHRRTDQRQTSEIPLGFVTRAGQARIGRVRVSGSAARVSRRGLGYTSRRTWGATLAVVRFRQHEYQCPTLVLLASRWKPEEHKNGSVCKTAADASKPEAFLAGVEVTKPLQQTGGFRFSIRKTARQQAVGPSFSVKEEDSACIQTDRNHGRGVAHVSTFGRNHAGGDGRTSAHDPRLLAAQQPPCHEQIPAGNIEDQTLGTGQIGRRDFADGYFAEDKPNPMKCL